ncbi:HNH endonuclease [Alloiococcus sp. CFN-8]|uniref:HNH endonuclease n=1 Tax=Alloiococcus sp. CFN-8 TaxID=3416081 RepID=UPI003CF0486C
MVKQRIQGAYKSDKFPDLFEYIASVFLTISFDEDYEVINKIYSNTSLNETEKELLSKVRVGQGIYREKLIVKYSGKCVLCGLKHKPLLIASHIKEWKNSTNQERLDENNGLLLCTMHESLFDKHLITFDDNGKILISSLLDDEDLSLLNINKNISIEINQKMKHYLKYHRESFEIINR